MTSTLEKKKREEIDVQLKTRPWTGEQETEVTGKKDK